MYHYKHTLTFKSNPNLKFCRLKGHAFKTLTAIITSNSAEFRQGHTYQILAEFIAQKLQGKLAHVHRGFEPRFEAPCSLQMG